jgi:2,3-bisphosphoglycerate-dependent phosphoglycerate mutase
MLNIALLSLVLSPSEPWLRLASASARRRASRAECCAPPSPGRLVLVRHGQSEWNAANLFTGWADADLSERGVVEAREGGVLLREEGLEISECWTSCLRRSIRTSCLLLSSIDQCYVPMHKTVLLNEQHCGALMGLNKRELAKEHGVEQVMRWRRDYDCKPPDLPLESPLHESIASDPRYNPADPARRVEVPRAESFREVCTRVQRLWDESLAPSLRRGKTVLVVSHGNTLRSLIRLLDGVSPDAVHLIDLPTAAPLVYDLGLDLAPIAAHGVWGEGDASVACHGRFLTDPSRVSQAQRAMREQVLRDISVTTDTSVKTEAPSRLADKRTQATVNIGGSTYNIRQNPPQTYFKQESERLDAQAQDEYRELADALGSSSVPGHKRRVKAVLVLLRHGRSVYNEANRFTGWSDVELTNRGREEARLAGRLLRTAGISRLSQVFTSVLKRAIKTAWLALDEMETQWTPVSMTWRLNERHYGALQGRDKKECVREHGLRQVQQWRRGYRQRPPPCEEAAVSGTGLAADRRYEGVEVPRAESLEDCIGRTQPFLHETLFPQLREAVMVADALGAEDVPTVLVCSSEHAIRSICMELEGLSEEQVCGRREAGLTLSTLT